MRFLIKTSEKAFPKGFTLLELLVSISIIGFLSSVVLASLGSSRDKAADANMKLQLSDMHTAVENDTNFGASGNIYLRACATTSTSGQMFRQAASLTDHTLKSAVCRVPGAVFYTDSSGTVVQGSAGNNTPGWAAAVKLRAGGYFCVDYTGIATITPTLKVDDAHSNCNGTYDPIVGG